MKLYNDKFYYTKVRLSGMESRTCYIKMFVMTAFHSLSNAHDKTPVCFSA